MPDDIVTRLERAKHENFGHYSAPPLKPILEDAIREIKHLKNSLWKYENCEMVCESPCEPDWEGGECETCRKNRGINND